MSMNSNSDAENLENRAQTGDNNHQVMNPYSWPFFLHYLSLLKPSSVGPDKINGIVRTSPIAVIVNLLNSSLATLGLLGAVEPAPLLVWWALTWLLCAYVWTRYQKARHRIAKRASLKAVKRAVLLSVLLAAPWGWLPIAYIGSAPIETETLLFGISAGMMAGGGFLLSRVPAASLAYMLTIALPFAVKCWYVGDTHLMVISMFALVYIVAMLVLVLHHACVLYERDANVKTLSEQMAALNQARDDIAQLAAYDSVTGLANRREFNDRLDAALLTARDTCSQIYLMLIDIDHFKDINDTLGHSAGDELLQILAQRLQSACSQSDLVARLGGDEFAILIAKPMTEADIEAQAQKFLSALSATVDLKGVRISSGCSIGVSNYPQDAADRERLMSYADIALYHAKEAGRGRVCIFNGDMRSQIRDREHKAEFLAEAIQTGGLEMYYQPQFDMRSATLVGMEALIRWHHPQFGTLAPGVFLQVAEERGMILEICDFVMEQTARDLKRWLDDGFDPGRIAINIHPAQLKHPDRILKHLEAFSQIDPDHKHINLEITEGCVIGRGTERIPLLLRRLRKAGYMISLDDFGTGYASLTHLKDLPVDEIKIDRRFTCEIRSSESDRAIVRSVIELAEALQIKVIAEGVEELEQAEFLCNLGCVYGQGYLYSRPVNRIQANEFIKEGVWATKTARAKNRESSDPVQTTLPAVYAGNG